MFPGVSENLSLAIRRFIPPPEHRPKREIEAEVREEIEFHLAMTAERISQEERLGEQHAREEALKRFGNPDTITKQCTRIAMKERIMLQRINTVLIALVAIGLVIFGVSTLQQQARTTAAFEQINEKLTGLASTPAGNDESVEEAKPTPVIPRNPDIVYVSAKGQRGKSVLLTPELTIESALEKAIGEVSPVPTSSLLVNVVRTSGNTERTISTNIPATSRFSLQSLDEIHIVGTDASLPWLLYTPNESDAAILDTIRTTRLEPADQGSESIAFREFFEAAASQLRVRPVFDSQDIEDHEYTLDREVSRSFLEALTLEQALDYACESAGYYNALVWDIHDGQLLVGSSRMIGRRAAVTSTYRVDDLLGPFPDRSDYQDLRYILQHAAGYDTWQEHGGDLGIYTEIEGRISITTIPAYHRAISSVLDALRDPQQHYPNAQLGDERLEPRHKLSTTTIGSELTADTTILAAIRHALDRSGLAYHIAAEDLETIGFEGDKPIRDAPEANESVGRLLTAWLQLGSPDDYDRAGWMTYGDGIVVCTDREVQKYKHVLAYEISSLQSSFDDEFVESIVELIQSRVDFDGWRDNGGDTGYVQHFQDLLVITTTEQAHREIIDLLDEYRSANAIADRGSHASHDRVVYISGGVSRPGVYQLASDSTMTVRQLIEVAGSYSIQPDSAQIAVTRTYADTGASRTWTFGPKSNDMTMPLEPGMSVAVSGEPPRQFGDPVPYQSQDLSTADEIKHLSSRQGGTVYIRGLIERPGTYAIPQGDTPFTVSRLIAAAGDVVGGNMNDPGLVFSINRSGDDAASETIFLDADRLSDFALQQDDLVQIARRPIQDGLDEINGADGSHP